MSWARQVVRSRALGVAGWCERLADEVGLATILLSFSVAPFCRLTLANPILTDNERNAAVSHAFLAALAAQGGYTLQRGPDPDTDSVDATIRRGSPRRDVIDIQLKATAKRIAEGSG